jgi:putative endonuclease
MENGTLAVLSNLLSRLENHAKGLVTSTRHRRPLVLIYQEEYEDKYEAFQRERSLKTAKGKRIIRDRLMAGQRPLKP